MFDRTETLTAANAFQDDPETLHAIERLPGLGEDTLPEGGLDGVIEVAGESVAIASFLI